MRSRRPRPSGSEQDYDSTPAEGLRPRCLILLLATQPHPSHPPQTAQDLSCFRSRSGSPAFFFFFLLSPGCPNLRRRKSFLSVSVYVLRVLYIEVKLTCAMMTERNLLFLRQGQDHGVNRYFRYYFPRCLKRWKPRD